MEILIQNKHMKGNSWVHSYNTFGRSCPLHEALEEKFPNKRIDVGAHIVTIFTDNIPEYYYISKNWDMDEAFHHIRLAQTDENYTVTVNLKPR